jgi:hypothetical protein
VSTPTVAEWGRNVLLQKLVRVIFERSSDSWLLEFDYGSDAPTETQEGGVVPLQGTRTLREDVSTNAFVTEFQKEVMFLKKLLNLGLSG